MSSGRVVFLLIVVTGAVGASPGTAKQGTCQASVWNGAVTLVSAEIRQ